MDGGSDPVRHRRFEGCLGIWHSPPLTTRGSEAFLRQHSSTSRCCSGGRRCLQRICVAHSRKRSTSGPALTLASRRPSRRLRCASDRISTTNCQGRCPLPRCNAHYLGDAGLLHRRTYRATSVSTRVGSCTKDRSRQIGGGLARSKVSNFQLVSCSFVTVVHVCTTRCHGKPLEPLTVSGDAWHCEERLVRRAPLPVAHRRVDP